MASSCYSKAFQCFSRRLSSTARWICQFERDQCLGFTASIQRLDCLWLMLWALMGDAASFSRDLGRGGIERNCNRQIPLDSGLLDSPSHSAQVVLQRELNALDSFSFSVILRLPRSIPDQLAMEARQGVLFRVALLLVAFCIPLTSARPMCLLARTSELSNSFYWATCAYWCLSRSSKT